MEQRVNLYSFRYRCSSWWQGSTTSSVQLPVQCSGPPTNNILERDNCTFVIKVKSLWIANLPFTYSVLPVPGPDGSDFPLLMAVQLDPQHLASSCYPSEEKSQTNPIQVTHNVCIRLLFRILAFALSVVRPQCDTPAWYSITVDNFLFVPQPGFEPLTFGSPHKHFTTELLVLE